MPVPPTTHVITLDTLGTCLRALSEPRRLLIFDVLLQRGVVCNCELGVALDMAPNLISHHLTVLREAGLVQAARDPHDARWVYYSVNRDALAALHAACTAFFDPQRIPPHHPACGSTADVAGSTITERAGSSSREAR
jgi:ArsR family transcriptional regulator